MVRSGQPDIRRVAFSSPGRGSVPVEVLDRAEMMRRFDRHYFDRPDRSLFTMLMFVWDGSGHHTIDFEQIELLPGRCLRIEPQQVHSWDVDAVGDVTLVLSSSHARGDADGQAPMRAWRDLDHDSFAIARSLIDALLVEQGRFDGSEQAGNLLVALFDALDAVVARVPGVEAPPALPAAYVDFRAALEASLGSTHDARSLIADLGYSERTVSRACRRATGLTAKGVLVERLVLEAKRLLAHTDRSASAIGQSLGFGEASNFHKFFVRHTGEGPNDFRRSCRPT